MKNWAWVLGMALTATMVGAQTTANNDRLKNAGPRDGASAQESGKHTVKSPRDTASGQASGKRSVQSPRDAASGQASGISVAAGDVDGDGRADVVASDGSSATLKKTGYDVKKMEGAVTDQDCDGKVATKGETGDCDDNDDSAAAGERKATKTRSNIQNNREASTGLATGKRQH
jgi:hypothetical protein